MKYESCNFGTTEDGTLSKSIRSVLDIATHSNAYAIDVLDFTHVAFWCILMSIKANETLKPDQHFKEQQYM